MKFKGYWKCNNLEETPSKTCLKMTMCIADSREALEKVHVVDYKTKSKGQNVIA